MKTFKEFLFEQRNVIKPWSEEEHDVTDAITAIKFLDKNCKTWREAVANTGIIFRGFSNSFDDNFKVIDSSTGHRLSRDTNNLYQIMMDASEALSEYPSRSKSFICHTSKAMMYGQPYVMVPFDAKIAVLDVDDIFEMRFDNSLLGGGDTSLLGNKMGKILSFLKIGPNSQNSKTSQWKWNQSPEELDLELSKIDPMLLVVAHQIFACGYSDAEIEAIIAKINATMPYDSIVNAPKVYALREYLEKHGTNNSKQFYDLMKDNPSRRFTALSTKIYTPSAMNLSQVNYGESLPQRKECWFSGKAALISTTLWYDILQELKSPKTESVNLEVFKKGFKKTKNVLDDKYTLIASPGWLNLDSSKHFRIVAKNSKGEQVATAEFINNGEALEAEEVKVVPSERRKGLATEIYKFAKELGNDINPSKLQTKDGKAFWDKISKI